MNTTQYNSAAGYVFAGLKRHPIETAIALSLMVTSAALTTIPSVYIGLAIDELTKFGISAQFIFICWEIVFFALAYIGINVVSAYVWARIVTQWERDARQEFFDTLQNFSMTFYDQVDSRRMLAMAMQDLNWIRSALNPNLRILINGVASFGVTAFILSTINYTFSMIVATGMPIYVYLSYRYSKKVEVIRKALAEEMEHLTIISQEIFRGIETVRTFGMEDYEKQKFSNSSKKYEEKWRQEGRLASFYLPTLVQIAMLSLAFFYGALSVSAGTLTVGSFSSVLALLLSLENFNVTLPRTIISLRAAFINARRIIAIMNWKDSMMAQEDPPRVIDWSGDIVFQNVSFKYSTNASYTLKDINVTIPGGSRVALIGGPGGGKSTLLKLLERLYDPTEGTISVGGVDLRTVPPKVIRNEVSLVEQEVFLFRESIRDNIAFGRAATSDEEVVEAARRAQAEEFILTLPDGYDTVIGERGMTLSGGQRQRLALARAIVQNPKILLLDDSVSAVDAKTELLMRKALEAVMKNRTSITVTQRLRTLVESDLVLIVDKGQLVAAGHHIELLKTSERYRNIFKQLPGAEAILQASPQQGGAA